MGRVDLGAVEARLGDRKEALALARLAQQGFAAAGPYLAKDRERVEAWLAANDHATE